MTWHPRPARIDALTGHPINWIDPRGYVRLRVPGHPLAGVSDQVPRHRLIVWDALYSWGDDPMTTHDQCGYCKWPLPWKSTLAWATRHVVNIDHVNNQPGDDRIENLLISCFWCNMNRSWCPDELGDDVWNQLIELHAHIDPCWRPSLPRVYTAFTGRVPLKFAVEQESA